MSWIALSLAIAMASCMAGWNAAAHRQEETGLMKFPVLRIHRWGCREHCLCLVWSRLFLVRASGPALAALPSLEARRTYFVPEPIPLENA